MGKPFPTKQVHIEVWGFGAFKFKGIAGNSKVRPDTAVRLPALCDVAANASAMRA